MKRSGKPAAVGAPGHRGAARVDARGSRSGAADFGRAAETGVTGEEATPCFSPAEYGALPGKVFSSVRPRFTSLGNGLGKGNAHLRGCAFLLSEDWKLIRDDLARKLIRDDLGLLRVVALNIV